MVAISISNMDKVILICASGRSGSTTTQRILNTMPNSNICGENMGAVNSLLECYRRLKNTTYNYVPGPKPLTPASYQDLIDTNYKPCWYNSYDFKKTSLLIKDLIINLFKNSPETNVWGFKEIRYDSGNIHYITEFKELFPQTKVIIQMRANIGQQAKSCWFKEDERKSIIFLQKYNVLLDQFYNANRDYCFLLPFEQMFDISCLRELFKFINCQEHFNEEAIKKILSNNMH